MYWAHWTLTYLIEMKEKYWIITGTILFLGISIFLVFNRHSRSGQFNYHSEIWGDKAGYYVYLPAALKYNFNPESFPDSIDSKTGNGFTLNMETQKVVTKYTCGVALMQSPFYLLADVAAKPLGYKKDGFSPIYHWVINVASAFYLTIGLFFLFKFLSTYFSKTNSLLALLIIFLTTNLYYYAIDETGMSHIFSFSLFCIFLYSIKNTGFSLYKKGRKAIIFGFLIGLIVLIRPTNVIFLFTFFFLDIEARSDIKQRAKKLLNLKVILPTLLGILLAFLPQLIYWKYATGSFIHYSYQDEGFNWLSPKLVNVWFAPLNGLFIYTPFYLIILASLIVMIKNKKMNGLYIMALFFLLSYVFSSWYDWKFGCAFGARSFVEYLSIFSIPVAYGLSRINRSGNLKKLSFYLITLVLLIVNLKMSYSYDGCFYGTHDWDWDRYFVFIDSLWR